ncbi:hypothetical protein J437_LFUL009368 [Ladona fulva]|uniref:Uncharacterized protein n=1 Tax=Ladona fulva TaxID=123851 RepID=A0A8K0K5X3_LADFU|nr:hypothetical protein J437_LFUL009368 [Ladona fulva]
MEMNELPNLVTSYSFKEKQYIVKMTLVRKNSLELSVIDKYSAEEWRCSYDSSYIENLTHKTGNFKQFDIFVAMLKSGLLQTSECVTLDLLTLEDLENLRKRRVTVNVNGTRFASQSTQTLNSEGKLANRRYLILTYTVEFDRIHYPLPLEYVGLPNPQMLQGTIRRLEAEIEKLKSKLIYEGERIDIEMWNDRCETKIPSITIEYSMD